MPLVSVRSMCKKDRPKKQKVTENDVSNDRSDDSFHYAETEEDNNDASNAETEEEDDRLPDNRSNYSFHYAEIEEEDDEYYYHDDCAEEEEEKRWVYSFITSIISYLCIPSQLQSCKIKEVSRHL